MVCAGAHRHPADEFGRPPKEKIMATSKEGNKQGGSRGGQGSGTSNRGFASMDPQRQREIASEGGKAAHQKGTAHEFTSEEARRAGSMSHGNRQAAQASSRSSGAAKAAAGKQEGNKQGGQQESSKPESKQEGKQEGNKEQGKDAGSKQGGKAR
jgi:hypothetical protein